MRHREVIAAGTLGLLICLNTDPLCGGTVSGHITKLDNTTVPDNIQFNVSPSDGTQLDVFQKDGKDTAGNSGTPGTYTLTLLDGVDYAVTISADDSVPARISHLNGSSTSSNMDFYLPNKPTCCECCSASNRRGLLHRHRN